MDVRLRVGTPHKEPSDLAGQAAKSAMVERAAHRSAATLSRPQSRRPGAIYIGEQRPGVWQSGWHLVLAAGVVVLLSAVAWYVLVIAFWTLEGK